MQTKFQKLESFLIQNGVHNIIPTDQLLRQGTDWKKVSQPPFAMPPQSLWSNMVKTLRVLKYVVIPVVGPVEVVSGYRTKKYNTLAGGSKGSKHLEFAAVDIVLSRKYKRADLHRKLEVMWLKSGKENTIGLGLYSGLRFNIDTKRYRRW